MSSRAFVGAFFDLDSTILPAPSLEWRFIGYLLERNQLRSSNVGAWMAHFAKHILLSPREATEANKRYLSGLRESLVRDWAMAGAELEAGSSEAGDKFFPEALARIAWHQARAHRVCIVSGTLAVLAREILRELPAPIDIIATELQTAEGYVHEIGECEAVWTGELSGAHMTGLAKARAVWRFADQHGVDLKQSYAYGDQHADLPMLDAVAHPVAVNPTKRLARVARANGWDAVMWTMDAGAAARGSNAPHATAHGATR
jgi:HAD superfamily hydrolase (TIGR01490 family)